MYQLISAILAVSIMFFGGYCMAYAVGAVKEHPVTWARRKIGSAIVFVLRLPFRLLGGMAQRAIKGGRRKRRRRI